LNTHYTKIAIEALFSYNALHSSVEMNNSQSGYSAWRLRNVTVPQTNRDGFNANEGHYQRRGDANRGRNSESRNATHAGSGSNSRPQRYIPPLPAVVDIDAKVSQLRTVLEESAAGDSESHVQIFRMAADILDRTFSGTVTRKMLKDLTPSFMPLARQLVESKDKQFAAGVADQAAAFKGCAEESHEVEQSEDAVRLEQLCRCTCNSRDDFDRVMSEIVSILHANAAQTFDVHHAFVCKFVSDILDICALPICTSAISLADLCAKMARSDSLVRRFAFLDALLLCESYGTLGFLSTNLLPEVQDLIDSSRYRAETRWLRAEIGLAMDMVGYFWYRTLSLWHSGKPQMWNWFLLWHALPIAKSVRIPRCLNVLLNRETTSISAATAAAQMWAPISSVEQLREIASSPRRTARQEVDVSVKACEMLPDDEIMKERSLLLCMAGAFTRAAYVDADVHIVGNRRRLFTVLSSSSAECLLIPHRTLDDSLESLEGHTRLHGDVIPRALFDVVQLQQTSCPLQYERALFLLGDRHYSLHCTSRVAVDGDGLLYELFCSSVHNRELLDGCAGSILQLISLFEGYLHRLMSKCKLQDGKLHICFSVQGQLQWAWYPALRFARQALLGHLQRHCSHVVEVFQVRTLDDVVQVGRTSMFLGTLRSFGGRLLLLAFLYIKKPTCMLLENGTMTAVAYQGTEVRLEDSSAITVDLLRLQFDRCSRWRDASCNDLRYERTDAQEDAFQGPLWRFEVLCRYLPRVLSHVRDDVPASKTVALQAILAASVFLDLASFQERIQFSSMTRPLIAVAAEQLDGTLAELRDELFRSLTEDPLPDHCCVFDDLWDQGAATIMYCFIRRDGFRGSVSWLIGERACEVLEKRLSSVFFLPPTPSRWHAEAPALRACLHETVPEASRIVTGSSGLTGRNMVSADGFPLAFRTLLADKKGGLSWWAVGPSESVQLPVEELTHWHSSRVLDDDDKMDQRVDDTECYSKTSNHGVHFVFDLAKPYSEQLSGADDPAERTLVAVPFFSDVQDLCARIRECGSARSFIGTVCLSNGNHLARCARLFLAQLGSTLSDELRQPLEMEQVDALIDLSRYVLLNLWPCTLPQVIIDDGLNGAAAEETRLCRKAFMSCSHFLLLPPANEWEQQLSWHAEKWACERWGVSHDYFASECGKELVCVGWTAGNFFAETLKNEPESVSWTVDNHEMRTVQTETSERVLGLLADPWQVDVLKCAPLNPRTGSLDLPAAKSAVVTAPTSAGKTFLAMELLRRYVSNDADAVAVFVSPTKAIAMQVFQVLSSRFYRSDAGDGSEQQVVGLLTGDYRSGLHSAQIIITIPEMLEIFLLSPAASHLRRRIRCLVVDEVHMISDKSRGGSFERLFIFTDCNFYAFSGTLVGSHTFTKWLNETRNKCSDVVEIPRQGVVIPRSTELSFAVFDPSCSSPQTVHPWSFLDSTQMIRDTIGSLPDLLPEQLLPTLHALHKAQLLPLLAERLLHLKIAQDATDIDMSVTEFLTTWLEQRQISSYPLRRCTVKLLDDELRQAIGYLSSCGPHECLVQDFLTTIREHLSPSWKCAELLSKGRKAVKALPIHQLMKSFQGNDCFPALFFALTKRMCRDLFVELHSEARRLCFADRMNGKQRGVIADVIAETVSKWDMIASAWSDDDLTEWVDALKSGVSLIHADLPPYIKGKVVHLLQSAHLFAVVDTTSLIQGVHTPCKTVVYPFDHQVFLTPETFIQGAGRAGRRGIQPRGQCILLGIPFARACSLAVVPSMPVDANVPLTASLLLRVLVMLKSRTYRVSETDAEMAAVRRLLEHPLFLQRATATDEGLHSNLRDCYVNLVRVSLLVLRRCGLLNNHLEPVNLALIVNRFHYKDPYNMLMSFSILHGGFNDVLNSSVAVVSAMLRYILQETIEVRNPSDVPVVNEQLKSRLLASTCFELPLQSQTLVDLAEAFNGTLLQTYHEFAQGFSQQLSLTLRENDLAESLFPLAAFPRETWKNAAPFRKEDPNLRPPSLLAADQWSYMHSTWKSPTALLSESTVTGRSASKPTTDVFDSSSSSVAQFHDLLPKINVEKFSGTAISRIHCIIPYILTNPFVNIEQICQQTRLNASEVMNTFLKQLGDLKKCRAALDATIDPLLNATSFAAQLPARCAAVNQTFAVRGLQFVVAPVEGRSGCDAALVHESIFGFCCPRSVVILDLRRPNCLTIHVISASAVVRRAVADVFRTADSSTCSLRLHTCDARTSFGDQFQQFTVTHDLKAALEIDPSRILLIHKNYQYERGVGKVRSVCDEMICLLTSSSVSGSCSRADDADHGWIRQLWTETAQLRQVPNRNVVGVIDTLAKKLSHAITMLYDWKGQQGRGAQELLQERHSIILACSSSFPQTSMHVLAAMAGRTLQSDTRAVSVLQNRGVLAGGRSNLQRMPVGDEDREAGVEESDMQDGDDMFDHFHSLSDSDLSLLRFAIDVDALPFFLSPKKLSLLKEGQLLRDATRATLSVLAPPDLRRESSGSTQSHGWQVEEHFMPTDTTNRWRSCHWWSLTQGLPGRPLLVIVNRSVLSGPWGESESLQSLYPLASMPVHDVWERLHVDRLDKEEFFGQLLGKLVRSNVDDPELVDKELLAHTYGVLHPAVFAGRSLFFGSYLPVVAAAARWKWNVAIIPADVAVSGGTRSCERNPLQEFITAKILTDRSIVLAEYDRARVSFLAHDAFAISACMRLSQGSEAVFPQGGVGICTSEFEQRAVCRQHPRHDRNHKTLCSLMQLIHYAYANHDIGDDEMRFWYDAVLLQLLARLA
jgi:hypothetical protein